MKIDKIVKNKNGKYKIIFDNKETITTYDDVLLKDGLLFKKEITTEELNEINVENRYYEIYNKTVKFISTKMRSLKEIVKFLDKHETSEKDKEKIIAKLSEIKLINDEQFANAYFQDRINLSTDGPYKIKQELSNNDISDEIIEAIYNHLDQDIVYQKLDKLIQKKIKSNHNKSNFMLKQKIVNDMVNLGYDKEMIIEILDNKLVCNNQVINNEYRKLRLKLSRKYTGSELDYQIKMKLRQKGFSKDEIDTIEED